ncbi:MAG: DUF3047 domain-containing protein [Candidatus Brocadiia bacterium]
MHRYVAALVVGALLLLGAGIEDGEKAEEERVLVDDFEGEVAESGLPAGWEEVEFEDIPRHTRYTVAKEDDNRFLRAEADSSASGLARPVSVDLEKTPMLTWRWRVSGTLEKGNARKKSGDDYPARVYVNFKYDPSRVGYWTRIKYALAKKSMGEYPPLHTVNYIWANRLERGTFIRNAFTERAMMVAVETGDEKAGEWVTERRNVYEDYKKAFGEEPTEVQSVAVMTDTDNTESSATGAYDDIAFVPAEDEGEEK